MNELGKRLDDLAKDATSRVRLIDPACGAAAMTKTPLRKRTLLIGLAALVAVGFMLAAWQRTDGSSRSVVAAQGDEEQSETVQTPCDIDAVHELLQAGIPTFDYEPAGSYLELADAARDIVTGRVVSATRTGMSSRPFVEITVADVVDVYTGESRDDVDVIAYDAVWADRSQVDPLAGVAQLEGVRFVGFLAPWSGVRGGWAPGAEGLYVGCGDDSPSAAVIIDGAGPGDPASPTLAQLIAILRAPVIGAMEDAERLAEEAARVAEEDRRLAEGDPVALTLAEAREFWAAADIQDYRLRYWVLGPEGFGTSVRVSVQAGAVSSFESYVSGDDSVADESELVYTIEDLFVLIANADSIREVEFDAARGFPTLVSIDPDETVPGDEFRLSALRLYSQADLEDIETAISSWLPVPTRPTEELRERLGRHNVVPPDEMFLLHADVELDVWLYRDAGDVCISVALKTGVSDGPFYGATTWNCVEDTQFVAMPTWLATDGAGVGPPYMVLVPPLSYLDENWTTVVQAPGGSRTLPTDRSVVVIFEDDGPIGGAYVEIQCDCGDIGRTLIIN